MAIAYRSKPAQPLETAQHSSSVAVKASRQVDTGARRPRGRRVSTAERVAVPTQESLLLESISDGLLAVDNKGMLTYVNARVEQVLGKSRDQLLGRNVQELFPVALAAPFYRQYERVLAEGTPAIFEAYYAPLRTWLETRLYPAPDGVTASLNDSTGRRKLEQALRRSLRRERSAHTRAKRDREAAEAARREAEITSQQLNQLQAVTDTALSHLAMAELIPAVLNRVREVMAVDSAALLLLADDGQSLTMGGGQGAFADAHVRIPLGQGIAGRVAASRKPLIVDDLSTIEHVNASLRDQLHSAAGVALLVEGRCIGVLLVGSAMKRLFATAEVQLLQVVADRIGLAIDHVQLYELARAGYAEAEARASELAATFAAMTDGVFVADRDGRKLRSNRAFQELLALDLLLTDEEVPPHARAALADVRNVAGEPVSPEALPTARILRGEVLQGSTALDLTMRALDGRVVEANVTGAPVRTTEGGIVGAVAVYRDVSERRRLERRVAEQASQLEGVFEAMADAIVVFDESGTILRTNAADRAMFAFDGTADGPPASMSERARRLKLRDERGHVPHRHQLPAFRVLRGETLRGSGAVELKARTMDGRELEVSESGAPIYDGSGRIAGGVLVVRDVTERRKLERRTRETLQALLDIAQVIVGPVDTEVPSPAPTTGAIVRRLGDLTRSVLGCTRLSITSLEPETGYLQPLLRIGWPAEIERQWTRQSGQFRLQDALPNALVERLSAGEVVVNNTVSLAQPTGWPIRGAARVLIAPLRLGSRLIGLLGLDFGDRRHRYTADERLLASAIAQLATVVLERERLLREREGARASELASREATRRMELFMAMAGHEFRTPLTVIKGYLQLAERQVDAGLAAAEGAAPFTQPFQLVRDSLEQTRHAAARMAGLLDDLLQVSRAQAGKLLMRPQPCDLNGIILASVNEHRQMHPARCLQLRLPASHHTPVMADPDRIGQVMTNYLTNAIKYSPEDRPIDVSVRIRQRTAKVSVRDRGPGLPAADQEHIWERFYQAASVERQPDSDAGLGLGLYVCRMIVEQHKGRVGVASAMGKGSTFWFTLPLATHVR